MIADRTALLDATTGVPPALDPDVTATAALPAARGVDVTDALALVVTVAPDPLVVAALPAAIDPEEAGANVDPNHARRRWLLLDFDHGHGRTTHVRVTRATHHTPNRRQSQEGSQDQATEDSVRLHSILLMRW